MTILSSGTTQDKALKEVVGIVLLEGTVGEAGAEVEEEEVEVGALVVLEDEMSGRIETRGTHEPKRPTYLNLRLILGLLLMLLVGGGLPVGMMIDPGTVIGIGTIGTPETLETPEKAGRGAGIEEGVEAGV